MEKWKTALWEATKVPLRALVLAIIPVGIAYFTESKWEYAGIAIFILTMIDKMIYTVQKETVSERTDLLKKWTGLTGF